MLLITLLGPIDCCTRLDCACWLVVGLDLGSACWPVVGLDLGPVIEVPKHDGNDVLEMMC